MAIGGMVGGGCAAEAQRNPEGRVILQRLQFLCELAGGLESLAADRLMVLIPVRPCKEELDAADVYVHADAPLFAEMAECLNTIKQHIDNTMATIRMTEV